MGDRAALEPLRRDVGGRAHEQARLGDGDVTLDRGYAEVGEHHAVGGEQHVAGLDVPVQDAGGVGVPQRVEHADADLGGLHHRQRPALPHGLLQRPGAHQLHDDPGTSVLLDDVVDGDDARVAEPRGGPCLAQHAPVRDLLARLVEAEGQDQLLDRDVAVKEHVVGVPDHAHATTADRREQAVAPAHQPSLTLWRDPGVAQGALTLGHGGRPPERAIGRHTAVPNSRSSASYPHFVDHVRRQNGEAGH